MTNRILEIGSKCNIQESPASTFKVILSLIGFNEKILKNEDNPKIEYKDEYEEMMGFTPPFDNWIGVQTPKSWMQNSVVWYSQLLTKELGMKKFQDYINKFNYGNKDLSGDHGKTNGLTHTWLSSSLKISSIEQIQFLEDFLIKKNVLISDESRSYTKSIMRREILDFDGWKVYGKTGSGFLLKAENKKDIKRLFGWFIGFMEKGDRQIIFADYIEKTNQSNKKTYLGKEAMEIAIKKLKELLSSNP